jgi:hypothetical protein
METILEMKTPELSLPSDVMALIDDGRGLAAKESLVGGHHRSSAFPMATLPNSKIPKEVPHVAAVHALDDCLVRAVWLARR